MKYLFLIVSLLIWSICNFASGDFDQLPQEIQIEITQHVGPKELINLSMTSKTVYKNLNPN